MMLRVLLLTLLLSGFSLAGKRVEVEFLRELRAAPGPVHLGMIAVIQGEEPLAESLRRLKVADMPQSGRTKVLYTRSLKASFVQPVVPVEQVEWSGEGTVTLSTLADTLPAQALEDSALALLTREIEWGRDSVAFTLSLKPRPLVVPVVGEWRLRVVKPKAWAGMGPTLVRFLLEEPTTGRLLGQSSALFNVARYRKVVELTDRVERGSRVRPEQIRMRLVDIADLRDFVSDSLGVVGSEAARTLTADRMLRRADVRLPQLVRRGDPVTLILAFGNATLRSAGTALQSGGLGERVDVKGESAGRKMVAEVVAPGEVRVIQ